MTPDQITLALIQLCEDLARLQNIVNSLANRCHDLKSAHDRLVHRVHELEYAQLDHHHDNCHDD